MKAKGSSETLVTTYQIRWHYPGRPHLKFGHLENLTRSLPEKLVTTYQISRCHILEDHV
jgi:hypothetical protein